MPTFGGCKVLRIPGLELSVCNPCLAPVAGAPKPYSNHYGPYIQSLEILHTLTVSRFSMNCATVILHSRIYLCPTVLRGLSCPSLCHLQEYVVSRNSGSLPGNP